MARVIASSIRRSTRITRRTLSPRAATAARSSARLRRLAMMRPSVVTASTTTRAMREKRNDGSTAGTGSVVPGSTASAAAAWGRSVSAKAMPISISCAMAR